MDFKPPRGTVDLLPPEGSKMRALYDRATAAARRHGYHYVETPSFEHTDLFTRTSGESSDIVRKEMYTFEDRGKRQLTLRPEATASIVRAYLVRGPGLPKPFKVFTIGPMWRYGRPQSGRLREFRQFDVEVIGEPGAAADVDVIAVGEAFLQDAGVGGVELQINSIGDANCRPAYREELIAFLRANRERLRDEHKEHFEENPLRVLDCKDERCREVAAEAPKIIDRLCADCRQHFDDVLQGLEDESIKAVQVPTLVRGLDYYTRTTFEWVSPRLAEGQSSVGGGGRYDGLAEVLGGPATPAVGFAIGLERVQIVSEEGHGLGEAERPDAFVVGVGDAGWALVREAARAVRRAGMSADLPFEPRALRTQLEMAARTGARYAVIIGEREAGAGTVTLRRLSDGHQEELSLDRAIERMAERGSTA
jgi:histidyl-tRNA synthetase